MSIKPHTTEITVHAYDWTIDDTFVVEDEPHVTINAWCLDRSSEPYLLRFHNFHAFCYVELPSYLMGRPMRWSQSLVDELVEWLSKMLGDNRPLSGIFETRPKLYYYRGTKTYPMILLSFNTLKAMYACERFLGKQHRIQGFGLMSFSVWETGISIIRKLLTLRNCDYSQWFTIQATQVNDEDHISTLNHEYICDWTTLTPIPSSQTKGWMTYPRVLATDIECYSPNHKAFPNRHRAQHVAYMISAIYQRVGHRDTRRRYLILLGDCTPFEGTDIIRVNSEVELCDELARLIRELDPEIITGYNILSFDYPYLDARLKRRFRDWPFMGRLIGKLPQLLEKTWQSDAYGHQDINILTMEGRISIDMLPLIRREHKLPKYDLDTVSKEFLKRGKHDVKAPEMFRIYEQLKNSDPQAKDQMSKVARYCVEDSELVIDLFERTNTWIGLVELSNIVGVTIMELLTRGQQVRCISQIYNLAAKLGIVLDKRFTSMSEFTGAYVRDPIPGLYDDVACLDFKSLYPSIIEAFNICYTTLVPPERDREIPDNQCHIIEWDEVIEVETEDDEGNEEQSPQPQHTKHYRFKFVKEPIGLLPKLVHRYVLERNNVRQQLKGETDDVIKVVLDKRQWALKITANSVFGFLGVRNGLLPLIEGAMCITAKGRELITDCNQYLTNKYHALIVYNDTDSTLFKLPFIQTHTEALEWGKKLEKEISDLFPDPLNVELEKVGRMFCIKKKKYVFWPLDFKTKELKVKEDISVSHSATFDLRKVEDIWLFNGKPKKLEDIWVIDPHTNERRNLVTIWNPNPDRIKREERIQVLDPETNELLTLTKTVIPDLMPKGIVTARRDNCRWQRQFFNQVLDNVMERRPMNETRDIIITGVLQFIRGQTQLSDLEIIRSLGSNYKSLNYFMKIFADELQRIGKPAAPGERLEYVVVNSRERNDKLGYKMRLPETYLERLESSQPERIDYTYYIEKLLMNCVEQLFQIGYKQELDALMADYKRRDYERVFTELALQGYQDEITQLWNYTQGQYDTMLEYLLQSPIKAKVKRLKTDYITRWRQLTTRIDYHPIKMMLKLINVHTQVMNELVRSRVTQPSINSV